MSTVYTSGTWKPMPGREHEFVQAWRQLAGWASGLPGAGQLQLTRDLKEEGRYVSFGDWQSQDAVRAWKASPEFKEKMAQVLRHVDSFQPTELGLVAVADTTRVHYAKDGIATFAATPERIFQYMSAGGHPHQAFKSHRLVGVVGNVVTVAVEAYNPDGSTVEMTVEHLLEAPREIVTTMTGGHFDSARFVLSYTPVDGGTSVDVRGDFPSLPGMSEADELAMIDGFFTTVFAEDAATLQTWSPDA